jgi:CubicO group peptidase (beta-lactamase class C family)
MAGQDLLAPGGRFITMMADVTGTPGGTAYVTGLFLYDRVTGSVTELSRQRDGTPGSDHTFGAAVSADGRYVALASRAANLIGESVPGLDQVLLHDLARFQPDEWIRRLSTLPLLYQPGERWLYNTGSDVLGVLIARAAGQPLEELLRTRVFERLGMVDTGFSTVDLDRLSSCYATDPETGERSIFDAPTGQWTATPAFPSGAGGLVSTLDDVHAFGRMLQSGGRLPDGSRLLSRASVEAMTTDQVGAERGAAGPSPDGSQGWGFGVGVQVRRTGLGPTVGSYGWAGGLGSSWGNDPNEDLVGVVLTTDAFVSAFPPPAVIQDFWTCSYAALDG